MGKYEAYIDSEFEDLIPLFMKNKKQEIYDLRKYLGIHNYDQIVFLGHRIKGSGSGYGFKTIGDIGLQLEHYGAMRDENQIYDLINQLETYIQSVSIIYIDM